jgi:hypothetical protein
MEQMLKGMPDSDGDGIPDILDKFMKDHGFSQSGDKWKNRRILTYLVIITSWGCCLAMVAVWGINVVIGKEIPPNLMNFGTTIFWAMNLTATATLATYTGISQADTNSYRKQMTEVIKAVPQAGVGPNGRQVAYGGYDYGNGNYAQNGYGQEYYGVGANGGNGNPAPPAPAGPTPVAPQPIDGPTQRKPTI